MCGLERSFGNLSKQIDFITMLNYYHTPAPFMNDDENEEVFKRAYRATESKAVGHDLMFLPACCCMNHIKKIISRERVVKGAIN